MKADVSLCLKFDIGVQFDKKAKDKSKGRKYALKALILI